MDRLKVAKNVTYFMKKILILAVSLFCLGGATMAQQKVNEVQEPTVYMGGSFTNAGVLDTGFRTYGLTTLQGVTGLTNYPLFSTPVDWVLHVGNANDSVFERTPFYAHSVSFEIKAQDTTASGARCDSTTFYIYGSKSLEGFTGLEKLLTSFTMVNNTNKQVFQYDVNGGVGNPFTNYRVTAICGNTTANTQVKWQAFMLVR